MSRNGQTEKFWVWAGWYMFGDTFSSRTQKMTLEHFWTAQIGHILKIVEKQKSQRTAWKMTVFGLQNTKTRSFQDIYLKCCTHVHLIEVCHIYFVFDNLKQNQYFFKKIFFVDHFETFQNFQNSRWPLDRSVYSQPYVGNQLFPFLNCLRGSVSRKPLFLPKTGETWRHSDVIYGGLRIKVSKFLFCQNVSNWFHGGYWIFGDDPHVTSGDISEKQEGGGTKNRPPVSRGLNTSSRYSKGNFASVQVFWRRQIQHDLLSHNLLCRTEYGLAWRSPAHLRSDLR